MKLEFYSATVEGDMLTVTINNPNFAPGEQLGVFALGAFTNGEPREITPEEEETFFNETGTSVKDLQVADGVFRVEGSPQFTPPENTTESVPYVPTPPVGTLEAEGAEGSESE